ncbi:MAG: RCC1 domain-containing protein, partial [Acidimicrobiaceae bacterium]|nr:RCC1 domain-containing protein [Acidimicrobiaceae bacterium]
MSRDGLICREGGPAQHQDLQFDNLRICSDDAFVRDDTFESSILVERGRDGSWAFYSSAAALQTAQSSDPVDLRGDSVACAAGLLLRPGDECSTGGFTMRIREDGAAVLDGNIGGISMGNTVMNAQSINLNRFNATRSGTTWTIESLPGTSSQPNVVPTTPTVVTTTTATTTVAPAQLDDSAYRDTPGADATRSTDAFEAVTAGGIHSCGLRTDDTITCWGDNDDG